MMIFTGIVVRGEPGAIPAQAIASLRRNLSASATGTRGRRIHRLPRAAR